jgi:cardiolipin synthase A/B
MGVEFLTDLPIPAWSLALATILNELVVFALIIRIVLQRRETATTLAWAFFLMLVPCLGVFAFWLLGANRFRLRRWRRRQADSTLDSRLAPLACCDEGTHESFPADPGLLRLVSRLDGAAQHGNAVRLFRAGKETFDALEEAIDAAVHHVHLTYYIWEPDSTGARLRDALTRACARGVEVRLLLDDAGCVSTPDAFFQSLVEAKGRLARFLPMGRLGRHLSVNHRNHRKLVVVDGQVGFTGGMNVGDAYAGLSEPWQDAHVRVEGPAVPRLQEIFCQDWWQTTDEDLATDNYFPATRSAGDEWVQFVASGPNDGRWHAIHMILVSAISRATTRVWLETPYFVPDRALSLALETAALRGVDVRMLLPGRSDHPLVLYAGRSFYGRLLAAGVKIYEVPKAFLHAKTATIDSSVATVGSANLDQRSFSLNFEANAFFFGPTVAGALEASFEATQGEAIEITLADYETRGRVRRLAEAAARLLGPIL